MPGRASTAPTLTLHAVRLLGFADTGRVARRFDQPEGDVEERLLDFEAFGWVGRSAFGGSTGWSLTDGGRAENGRQLGAELEECGARDAVSAVHAAFLPLNARFQEAATRWQLRPLPGDPMAANDHTDHRWDDRVIGSVAAIGRQLAPLVATLSAELDRFRGYDDRYAAAAARVAKGERRWLDGVGVDSCHTVWMQLHEDLVATLGLERGQEA